MQSKIAKRQTLNKREYMEALEQIRDSHRKGCEGFFKTWNISYHQHKHTALLLYIFVETLIARELYQLEQEGSEANESE